jgi:methylmalonyl-CoA epimerase
VFRKIDHIGIATSSIERSLTFWRDVCGLQAEDVVELPSQGVRVCMLCIGDSSLELIEPTEPDSAVASFIQKRGEGLLHVCFEVEQIEEVLQSLAEKGCRLVDPQPWQSPHGLAAFVHPKAAFGVSIELRQHDV